MSKIQTKTQPLTENNHMEMGEIVVRGVVLGVLRAINGRTRELGPLPLFDEVKTKLIQDQLVEGIKRMIQGGSRE